MLFRSEKSQARADLQKLKMAYHTHSAPRDKARYGTRYAEALLKTDETELALTVYREVATIYAKEGFLPQAIAINKIVLSIEPQDQYTETLLSELYSKKGISYRKETNRFSKLLDEYLPSPTPFAELSAVPDSSSEPGDFKRTNVNVLHQLPKYPLFSDLADVEFQKLIHLIELSEVESDQVIFKAEDPADAFYLIVEGEVSIISETKALGPSEIARLKGSEFFGEFGLLAEAPRQATAISRAPTSLLVIRKPQFDQLRNEHPGFREAIDTFYKERIVDKLLAESLLFRGLNAKVRAETLHRLDARSFVRGEVILKEGDRSRSLYIVKRGSVELLSEEKLIGRMGPGTVFGELALLLDTPRTATVRCFRDTELFELSALAFTELQNQYPEFRARLAEIARTRRPDIMKPHLNTFDLAPDSVETLGLT